MGVLYLDFLVHLVESVDVPRTLLDKLLSIFHIHLLVYQVIFDFDDGFSEHYAGGYGTPLCVHSANAFSRFQLKVKFLVFAKFDDRDRAIFVGYRLD